MPELTRDPITERLQLEILARETGFTVIVDVDEEENPEYYVTFSSDPNSFSKVFNRIAEAATSMVNFMLTKDDSKTTCTCLSMRETAKDLHTAGVMPEQAMEKFEEQVQDTKKAWWNGAREALGLPLDTPRKVVSASFLSKPKPTLADFLDVLHESIELSSADELKRAVKLIIEVQAMDSGMRDCIRAAYLNGPIDDGDVPSKSGRDALLDSGYISKVVVKGEQGFNACTYKGSSAYKLIVAGA